MIVERVPTPRGELVLRKAGEHFEIVSNGVFLVDTRDGRSERLLAAAALGAHAAPAHILVGGLGVGFTLAAVLADARVRAVTVVEVEPAVIAWQRSVLARFSGNALDDPRVSFVTDDLVEHLASADAEYDAVCLDIDNGPDWTVTDGNARLYSAEGTSMLRGSLRPGGVLAVWGSRAVPWYEALLSSQFDHVAVHEVPVDRGEPDVVYIAVQKDSSLAPR